MKEYTKRDSCMTMEEVIERNTGMSLKAFLTPQPNPYIHNMDRAVEFFKKKVNDAAEEKEILQIKIVGDYDADGMNASAILYDAIISYLKANSLAEYAEVSVRLPRRYSEGYGLSKKIIDESESGLIITVDNGIAAIDAIKKAKDKGMLSLFQDDRIIAVIDTETTGINSNKDRIVQFSGKKYRIRDQKMEQIAEMDIYIKAPFPMPEAAMRVNGITDEFLADKPSEEDVVAEICAFMEGSILVGYNVDFDIRMISALCDRTHTPLQCSGKMDVLEVARDFVEKKEVQNHKLETISKYFGIDEGITFHSSIDDVEATARLLLLFYTMYCEQDMHGEGKTKLFIEYTYFWKGYRKEQAGVYVQTNLGKVYFSTYKKEWCSSQLDLTQIDLDALETDILVRLGITYDELSKMTEKKYHLLEKNA